MDFVVIHELLNDDQVRFFKRCFKTLLLIQEIKISVQQTFKKINLMFNTFI